MSHTRSLRSFADEMLEHFQNFMPGETLDIKHAVMVENTEFIVIVTLLIFMMMMIMLLGFCRWD